MLNEFSRSEERFRLVVESAPNAILMVDKDRKIVLFNKQSETLFGYRRDEVLGKEVELLVPERFRSDHPAFIEEFFKDQEPRTFQSNAHLYGLRKDGTEVPVEIGLSTIVNSNGRFDLIFVTDLTERLKERELLDFLVTQLKAQKTALDQFAIVAETDAHGKITYVNDQFCKISKYTREELLGKDHRDVANSGYHSREFWRDFWSTIQAGKVWRGDVCNRDKEGVVYWEDTTIVPFLGEDGKPEKYLAIRANITERKLAEEAVLQYAQVKSEFVSMVSHELRTPLTIIKEGVSIVQDGSAGPLNPEQMKCLDMVKNHVNRLTRLINDVLDFQKLESKHTELNLEENDINFLLDEIKQMFSITATAKDLEFLTDLEGGLPRLLFDRDKIIQVLTNLVGNAVRVTGKGRITLKTRYLDQVVRVSVEDEGPGIRKEDLEKLFKPFSQLAAGGKKKTGSTGLGLAISKQIIELHKGQIGVVSVYGKGATFYFSLPTDGHRTLKKR